MKFKFFKKKKPKKIDIELKHLSVIWLSDKELEERYKKNKFEQYKNQIHFKKEIIENIWQKIIKNYLNINFIKELEAIQYVLNFYDEQKNDENITFIINKLEFCIKNISSVYSDEIIHAIVTFLFCDTGLFFSEYEENPTLGSLIFFEKFENETFYEKVCLGITNAYNTKTNDLNVFSREINRLTQKFFQEEPNLKILPETKNKSNKPVLKKEQDENKEKISKEQEKIKKRNKIDEVWENHNTESELSITINNKKNSDIPITQQQKSFKDFMPDQHKDKDFLEILFHSIKNDNPHFFIWDNFIYIKYTRFKYFLNNYCDFSLARYEDNTFCLNFLIESQIFFEKKKINISFEKIKRTKDSIEDEYIVIPFRDRFKNPFNNEVIIKDFYKIKQISVF